MIVTHRFRIKSSTGSLVADARKVSFVWNFCNATQQHAVRLGRKWLTGYDLASLASGSSKELALHSGVISQVCLYYARSRFKVRKRWLRYRGKRNLGWIPFQGKDVRVRGASLTLNGKRYRFFKSRDLPEGKITDGGCFTQDARGRWYVCIPVEVPDVPAKTDLTNVVGVDLGLKSLATLSTGEKIEAPQHYRKAQERLAKAQRARKKRLVRTLHAKVRNSRADHLHKVSTRLVTEFDGIVVGDVNSSALAKTRLSKSVLDAGWGTFRNMLRYKARTRGVYYQEVPEKLTSQLCSSCGELPPERPKGIAGLGIRRWCCSACGSDHDRDVNAARNILARSGHRALGEGVSAHIGSRKCQHLPRRCQYGTSPQLVAKGPVS